MDNLGLIIEPDELANVINNPMVSIIDLCSDQTYHLTHIPGALHINPASLVSGIKPATGKLPNINQLNDVFSKIGYDPKKHYVVYDDEGGGWAGRFIWTLDVIGHKHYSYLNGGLHSWYNEKHPVENKTVSIASTQCSLNINNQVIADLETVLDSLDNPNIKIWDARSSEEYSGIKLSSRRGGHIPGAINLDWLDTMDKNRNLRILPLPVLQEMLDNLGIITNNEIITHCQSHHRSGLTYLIAKALGYKVKAYHGSWSEWGNLDDTPIEK